MPGLGPRAFHQPAGAPPEAGAQGGSEEVGQERPLGRPTERRAGTTATHDTGRDTQTHLDIQSQILGDRDTQIEKHSHTGTDTLLHQDTQAYLDTQIWTHSQVRPRIKKTHTSSDTDSRRPRDVDTQTETGTADEPGHTHLESETYLYVDTA